MCRFVESICIEGGKPKLLDLHQARLDRTFAVYYAGAEPWQISSLLRDEPIDGLYKCRFLYDDQNYQIEFRKYRITPINSLKIVEANDITYDFKTLERDALTHLFEQRGKSDDIIILKNGLLADSYYANLAFFDGDTWITPERPLLKGIKRERLIREGLVKEFLISYRDLQDFQKVSLINAMLDLGEVEIQVERIVF